MSNLFKGIILSFVSFIKQMKKVDPKASSDLDPDVCMLLYVSMHLLGFHKNFVWCLPIDCVCAHRKNEMKQPLTHEEKLIKVLRV